MTGCGIELLRWERDLLIFTGRIVLKFGDGMWDEKQNLSGAVWWN